MKALFRRRLLVLMALVTLASCGDGGGGDSAADARALPVLVDDLGVAIEGYDPVAYFVAGEPRKGSAEYTAQWNGATWRFASAANRDLFVDDPAAYAPAYGGWCAYGMAEGYAAETDPENGWTVHEGRLYLNWDAQITEDWRVDRSSLLEKSEANWPTVEAQLQAGEATVYWHE